MVTQPAPRARSLTGRSVVGLGLMAVVLVTLVVWLPWFLRPGAGEVLRGLAQHAFVLAWLLVVTHSTRTVSLATLGLWWLVGVYVVFVAIFVAELPLDALSGAGSALTAAVLSPPVEEAVKLLAVAVFLWLAMRGRAGRPSASDALLIGFVIGAGVSFNEDALIGRTLLSGAGWDSALPWSLLFPTLSPQGIFLGLNHAIWAALSGLGLGAAVLFRHVRGAWIVAVVAFVLSLANHMTTNHFVQAPFQALGREAVPTEWAVLQTLEANGVTPLVALLVGLVAVVVLERRALMSVAWVGRMFPAVGPFGRPVDAATGRGAAGPLQRVAAASLYRGARRRLAYAVWQARRAGRSPDVPAQPLERLAALGRAAGTEAGTTPTAAESGVMIRSAEPNATTQSPA